MASSLAAAIEKEFGIQVKLREGHNGIYEVSVNNNVIYTNKNKCSQIPKDEEVFQLIRQFDYATKEGGQEETENTKLDIEFMYLDLSVCTWCQSTESNLEEAISEVAQVLKATGVEVNLRKIHIQSEEQAKELGFISSPTIRINGQDIQLDVKEALCDSCGDLCGDTVDCRIWTYRGKEYTAPPKGMIIDAVLGAIYGGTKESIEAPVKAGEVPDNLRKFFAAKRRKQENEIISCCSPSSNDTCT